MSFGLYVDMAVSLVQQLMFVGFLNLFFETGKSKLKNIIAFASTVLLLFTVSAYFTAIFPEHTYEKIIIITAILLVYTLCFLKGTVYMRIIAPVVIIGMNIVLADLSMAIMMHVMDTSFVNTVPFPDSFKYLYIIVSNFAFALLLFNLFYIAKTKVKLTNVTQLLIFISLGLIIYFSALCDLLIYEMSGFNEKLLPYIFIIGLLIFSLAGLFWYLLMKVSHDEKLKTELLLSTQREEMYKNSVMNTNTQIEKLSQVKHDMKNHIMSVNSLILNGEYERAGKLCESLYEKLNVPALSLCENPVLNAIINVEMEKAYQNKIEFTYDVSHTLSFVEDSDIVSIVGNLCDNAVEYLCSVDESKRRMNLAISSYKGYCYVTCKNVIRESVLKENPNLSTTKNTPDHGNGMKILSNIAKKYDGELLFKEQESELSVSVIIRKKK